MIGYPLCGNGSISFRVAGLSANSAFAGISLRTGPPANAVKAELLTNHYFTGRTAVRNAPAQPAWPYNFFLQGQPWFRLERMGNRVIISTSTNGMQWTVRLVRDLALPNCLYVGMMAYGPGAVTATFDNVSVNNGRSMLAGDPTTGEAADFRLLPSDFRLQVYPNPTAGTLTVELPQDISLDGATLQVIDLYGRVLQTRTTLDYRQELDLSGLPAGTYFVRVQTAGQSVWTERIVLQR